MDFIIDEDVFRGHDNYLKVMSMIKNPAIDVSRNDEFRKAFSGYYFPAQVSEDFKNSYFSYMQQLRATMPTYEAVLGEIYRFSGAVHYSFASKLLHTLDAGSPVLDQHIMRLLGFQIIGSKQIKKDDINYQQKRDIDAKSRIAYYCQVHDAVSKEYERYENTKFMQDAIARFDSFSPTFKGISYTKKVDMLLFRLRNERGASVLDYLFTTK